VAEDDIAVAVDEGLFLAYVNILCLGVECCAYHTSWMNE
jgi:hypothetical protein